MIETFTSKARLPLDRGEEFGAKYAEKIAANIEIYHRLFLLSGKRSIKEIRSLAESLFGLVQSHSPGIAEEIQGIARGAQVPVNDVMALNARTELLSVCGAMFNGKLARLWHYKPGIGSRS